MADNTASSAADESNEQQLTFNVKSSSDQKFVLTVPASITVSDLKQKLSTSEYAAIPPERQRLIYSGRVLKDPDTLGSCKIKDGNTVHLVKGAESNQRQNPANQGGAAAPSGVGSPASNVPSNIASGQGANNPLAHLTGARYAGFHGLPGMDTFGTDGGMGAPPDPDQMLRLLEDPAFAQQMNEAMNNPAVIDMLRNNPMIRGNPSLQAFIDNPELRRMMMNPQMIRFQMEMQRAMNRGGGGGTGGGASGFPMPGQTDTTPSGGTTENAQAQGEGNNSGSTAANAQNPFGAAGGANPFAALFPGAGAGAGAGFGAAAGAGAGAGTGAGAAASTGTGGTESQERSAGSETNSQQPPNPFGNLFGGAQGGQQQNNPFAQAAQQMMQNPELMRQFMQNTGGAEGGFNPFGALGGMGSPEPQAPADNRPPEERYADQLQQLNDMGFYEFERNVQALRRSGGSVQGAVEYLLTNI